MLCLVAMFANWLTAQRGREQTVNQVHEPQKPLIAQVGRKAAEAIDSRSWKTDEKKNKCVVLTVKETPFWR